MVIELREKPFQNVEIVKKHVGEVISFTLEGHSIHVGTPAIDKYNNSYGHDVDVIDFHYYTNAYPTAEEIKEEISEKTEEVIEEEHHIFPTQLLCCVG